MSDPDRHQNDADPQQRVHPSKTTFYIEKNGLHVVTIHNDTLSIEFFSHGFFVFFTTVHRYDGKI
jgi:hypothetical protein